MSRARSISPAERFARSAVDDNARDMFELQRFIGELSGHAVRDSRAALSVSRGDRVPGSVQSLLPFKDAKAALVELFEREYVVELLRRCGGNITRAGRESGLHRKSIERLVKKYQLDVRALKAARDVSVATAPRP